MGFTNYLHGRLIRLNIKGWMGNILETATTRTAGSMRTLSTWGLKCPTAVCGLGLKKPRYYMTGPRTAQWLALANPDWSGQAYPMARMAFSILSATFGLLFKYSLAASRP